MCRDVPFARYDSLTSHREVGGLGVGVVVVEKMRELMIVIVNTNSKTVIIVT